MLHFDVTHELQAASAKSNPAIRPAGSKPKGSIWNQTDQNSRDQESDQSKVRSRQRIKAKEEKIDEEKRCREDEMER